MRRALWVLAVAGGGLLLGLGGCQPDRESLNTYQQQGPGLPQSPNQGPGNASPTAHTGEPGGGKSAQGQNIGEAFGGGASAGGAYNSASDENGGIIEQSEGKTTDTPPLQPTPDSSRSPAH